MGHHTNQNSRLQVSQRQSSRGLFNVNAQANSVTLPGADLSSALRRSMQVRSRREMAGRRRGAASLEEIASLPTFEFEAKGKAAAANSDSDSDSSSDEEEAE